MRKLITIIAFAILATATALPDEINDMLKTEHFRKLASDGDAPARQRIEAIDGLIKLRPQEADRLLLTKGSILKSEGRYAEAIDIYTPMLEREQEMPLHLRCALLHDASIALGKCNELTESAVTAERLLALTKPDSLLKWDFRTYIHLHDLYLNANDLVSARSYETKAAETLKRMKGDTREEQARLHGTIAATYIDEGEYDAAFAELKAMTTLNPSPELGALALAQTGQIYQAKGDNAIARYYYEKALEKVPTGPNAKSILAMLAISRFIDGDIGGVLELMDSNVPIMEAEGAPVTTVQLLNLRAKVYERMGDYRMAYDNLSAAILLADSIETERMTLKNRDLKTQIEERRFLDNREAISRRATVTSWAAGILALTTVTLLAASLLLLRRRRRAAKAVGERDAEIERLGRRIEELSTEIADSECKTERRMGAATLRMAQITSALDSIRRAVASRTSTKEQRLEAIRREINGLKIQENLWEIFSMQFEKVNQEFLQQLTERHPDLTRAEQNMCAYMVLNLSTKEIAEITHRSIRTVEAIKYTLRKKLGVTPDATELYLRSFTPRSSPTTTSPT